MLPSSVRYPIEVTLLAAAYLAVALVGLAFAIPPGNATAVWPASGVALAAVMLRGPRIWPAIWVGALLANATTSVSIGTAATIATGNTIEALLAAWLCRRWLAPAEVPFFQRVEHAFLFAAVSGIASLVAATVGGASLVFGGYAARSQFSANWATWWMGDVAGLVIVVPLVLAHAKTGTRPWRDSRRAELGLLFALMLLASQAIFGGWLEVEAAEHLLYVPLIFLVWVCLRFALAEVTLATALFAGFAIVGASAGLGPFQEEARRSLFHLQMFMNVYAVTALAFAAVVAGRRASEQRLQRSHEELEGVVADRTHALTVSNEELRQQMAERRAAEEHLREREARYRDLIQNLHVGVVIHAPDTTIVLSNDRAAELLAVPASMMPGKTDEDPAWSFVREDGTPMPLEEYPVNRVLATEQPLRDLVCGINRPGAGGLRWVLVNALPEFGAARQLTGVVVTFMDITERRRLTELERLRLDSALEAIGDGILITDGDGNIQYVNPAFERVTGYSRPEVLGRNPRVLQGGQHDAAFYRQMWRALAGGESWHGEFVDKRKDGRLYEAETTITRIRDGAGDAIGYVGVQRDVSDRKRAAAVNEQLRLARSIQQSFFPKAAPSLDGFDLGGASFPAHETGGDYYDYFELTGGRIALVVADASGHGIGPALVMSQMRAYLQALTPLDLDVSDLATRLNTFLLADGQDERFVTLFLAQLDPRDASFVYASAGHRCYLLGEGDEVQMLDATSIPLGIMPVCVPSAAPRTLRPGQVLLFVTDGLEDTLSPEGEPFGVERLLAAVRMNRDRPAREIVERVCVTARQFAQDTPQPDDITAVVLKVGERPRQPE